MNDYPAQLIGGPQDGTEIVVERPWVEVAIAEPRSYAGFEGPIEGPIVPSIHKVLYRARISPDGFYTRWDDGTIPFDYEGEST